MIPHIIHQIWLQGEMNIPVKFQSNVKKIKRLHPTWEYILWDEIMIINLIKTNSQLINTYYKFAYLVQKVDFARYIILYHYGGVYIDIDAYTLKPLDDLLAAYADYDMIVSLNNMNKLASYTVCGYPKCIKNGVIISKQYPDILKHVINAIVAKPQCHVLSIKQKCIFNTTGPSLFTDIIYKYGDNKVKMLPYDYLEPCILGTCNPTDRTVIYHDHASSWSTDTEKKLLKFVYDYHMLLLVITFSVFGFIIYKKISPRLHSINKPSTILL